MASSDRVHLGTITFPADVYVTHVLHRNGWTQISSDDIREAIDRGDWAGQESKMRAETLINLLNDVGLGFESQGRMQADERFVIRASLVPADALTSEWTKSLRGNKNRPRNLKRLFDMLEDGWEGEGANLISRSVRRCSTLIHISDVDGVLSKMVPRPTCLRSIPQSPLHLLRHPRRRSCPVKTDRSRWRMRTCGTQQSCGQSCMSFNS